MTKARGRGGNPRKYLATFKKERASFPRSTVGLCVVIDSNYDAFGAGRMLDFLFSPATIQNALMLCILQFQEFSS
jgi:hypothetical protein